jgi:two-component system response regulator TrcR
MYRPDGSPIRVLLVDDERALTNLVRIALQYEGWEIDVAHDAREAVDKYRANTRDLIVLDIMLPDMDGIGVLQQIRESDTYTPTHGFTHRRARPLRRKSPPAEPTTARAMWN